MQDFDALKEIWNQPSADGLKLDKEFTFSKDSATAKTKLLKEQLVGGIVLVLTSIGIGLMALFFNFNFKHFYTYLAMILLVIICLAQAAILFYTYFKLKQIDDTATPPQHLEQWEAYYAFRQKQVKIYMPAYFVALNLAMGLYLFEILSGRPILNVIIFLSVYAGWMIYAIFFLGRKKVKQENKRLQGIIDELKAIEHQFTNGG